MSEFKRRCLCSKLISRSPPVLFASCLMFSVTLYADESDERSPITAAERVVLEERYAERLQFHQLASLALDQAQVRLEKQGFKNIASRRELGYSSHPISLKDILPFHILDVETSLPLALFEADSHAAQGISRQNMLSLMESFNIQLHENLETVKWPDDAILKFELQSNLISACTSIQATMQFDSTVSSYYFSDPFDAYQELMTAVLEITKAEEKAKGRTLKPSLRLISLSGFEALATELEPTHFPRGVPITHSMRLGKVRLHTDFSWLGRPKELLALSPPQFLL